MRTHDPANVCSLDQNCLQHKLPSQAAGHQATRFERVGSDARNLDFSRSGSVRRWSVAVIAAVMFAVGFGQNVVRSANGPVEENVSQPTSEKSATARKSSQVAKGADDKSDSKKPEPEFVSPVPAHERPAYRLIIHGGARSAPESKMTKEQATAYREMLRKAVIAGRDVLDKGGSSLDAVEAVIVLLEDSPLFNAGKGAVFTADETHELDASIMDGSNQRAGAVAGIKHVRNPILLARAVMERTPHVMLIGESAEVLAKKISLEMVPNEWFSTDGKREELDAAKAKESAGIPATPADKLGTVGCVALDRKGRLAAGTSTGGLTNKRLGRVGDSPIIGAGTYANANAAASCTGSGEFFIRTAAAHHLVMLVDLQGHGIQDAAHAVIHNEVGRIGGDGGMIAMNAYGEVAAAFNTAGLFRAWAGPDDELVVEIFEPEPPIPAE